MGVCNFQMVNISKEPSEKIWSRARAFSFAWTAGESKEYGVRTGWLAYCSDWTIICLFVGIIRF